MSDESGIKPMGQVIQIDEARIRDHLGEMVRGTVEETLNAMLDAEADQLCGAGRYERNQARQDTRAGSYERTLHTKAGDVSLKIPKLRRPLWCAASVHSCLPGYPAELGCARNAPRRKAGLLLHPAWRSASPRPSRGPSHQDDPGSGPHQSG